MNYLVTGGHGVIGARLVARLREMGHDVHIIDQKRPPFEEELSIDVTRFDELWSLFDSKHIDYVVHLAGEVGRMVGEMRPTRMIYTNLIGTINLIQLCLAHKARFVLFSTSEVYGDLHDQPLCEHLENATPFRPTNIYAMSKMYAEGITRHYVANYDLPAIIIRPFMVYGPGEYPGPYRSALTNFVYQTLTGRKVIVHRGAIRSWTYTDDFVNGVIAACERGDYAGAAYNIGRDEPCTMEEVAQTIKRLLPDSKSFIELQDPPTKFISRVKRGCFCKATTDLGWVSSVPLEEGLARTIEWQRQHVREVPLP